MRPTAQNAHPAARILAALEHVLGQGSWDMRGKVLWVSIAMVVLSGCSVGKAVNQPKAKDLSVLDVGTSRDRVLLELGAPVVSEKDADGNQTDYFKFIQGQHGAAKAGKGLLYGALAVTTLGLSEIVTNPVDGTAGAGKEMQIKVTYDAQNAVHLVDVLKDARWIRVQKVGEAAAATEPAGKETAQ
jgi:outer membrane protein assembly factor BamE (lipoprotein component of BamABCDE complex)